MQMLLSHPSLLSLSVSFCFVLFFNHTHQHQAQWPNLLSCKANRERLDLLSSSFSYVHINGYQMNGKDSGYYDLGILLVWFGFSCPCRGMCHHNSKQSPSNSSPLSYNETFLPWWECCLPGWPQPNPQRSRTHWTVWWGWKSYAMFFMTH